jgi:hypothetical protein
MAAILSFDKNWPLKKNMGGSSMKLLAYILFFVLLSTPVAAQYDFQSDQNFSSFICNYYLNPQPEHIVSLWDYYVDSKYFDGGSVMMAAFQAAILKENTSLLKTLFDEHLNNNPARAKLYMLRILLEINTPQSREYLVKAQKEWKEDSVQAVLYTIETSEYYDVLVEIPRDTEDLDRLWGIFWATGNSKAISQIISILYLWEEGRGATAATGGSAMWSLSKYSAQHPRILQIVKSERDNASGTKKKLLEKIVSKAEVK